MLSVEEACAALQESRGDALAVLTMTPLAYWQPRAEDYQLIGLMGSAGSIGLGLALGRPTQRVLVVDGDGSLLMQLGVLTAIGGAQPANLVHVVIDNGVYAVSGAQPVPGDPDWPGLMLAAGFPRVVSCETAQEIIAALIVPSEGPLGIVIRCDSARPDYPEGWLRIDPAEEAHRVRAALAQES